MANLYTPSTDTLRFLKGQLTAFFMEIDDKNTPVLLIKYDASVIESIIKGCQIEIIIRNPHIEKNSTTVYIYDSINNPIWMTQTHMGPVSVFLPEIDELAFRIVTASKITIALFNEFTHFVHSFDLNIAPSITHFEHWIKNVYNNDLYIYPCINIENVYGDENQRTGYSILLNNTDHSHEDFIRSRYYFDNKNIKPEQDGYSYADYKEIGQHGYNQEISISNYLYMYFEPDEYYIAPLNEDGSEFSDFIICYANNAIILESKYIVSPKQTKLSQSLKKAIFQLNRVESQVKNKSLNLRDKTLEKRLYVANNIIKVCLLNDSIILNHHNSYNILSQFQKTELPLFISSLDFFKIVKEFWFKFSDEYKMRLIQLLLYGRSVYMKSKNILFTLD